MAKGKKKPKKKEKKKPKRRGKTITDRNYSSFEYSWEPTNL